MCRGLHGRRLRGAWTAARGFAGADGTRGFFAHDLDCRPFALRFATRGIDGGHLHLGLRRRDRNGFSSDAQSLTFIEEVRVA